MTSTRIRRSTARSSRPSPHASAATSRSTTSPGNSVTETHAIPAEQAALLAAIVAKPDKDAPRLAYADWLQERGYVEQAQFIRDSIKLAGMRPRASDYKPLAQRLARTA